MPQATCEDARDLSAGVRRHMNLVLVLAWIIATTAVYFLGAGLSFALMYRIGPRFPSLAAGIVFAPLEWLAGRVPPFRRIYNRLCVLCYRVLASGPPHDGWPPTPPRL